MVQIFKSPTDAVGCVRDCSGYERRIWCLELRIWNLEIESRILGRLRREKEARNLSGKPDGERAAERIARKINALITELANASKQREW